MSGTIDPINFRDPRLVTPLLTVILCVVAITVTAFAIETTFSNGESADVSIDLCCVDEDGEVSDLGSGDLFSKGYVFGLRQGADGANIYSAQGRSCVSDGDRLIRIYDSAGICDSYSLGISTDGLQVGFSARLSDMTGVKICHLGLDIMAYECSIGPNGVSVDTSVDHSLSMRPEVYYMLHVDLVCLDENGKIIEGALTGISEEAHDMLVEALNDLDVTITATPNRGGGTDRGKTPPALLTSPCRGARPRTPSRWRSS